MIREVRCLFQFPCLLCWLLFSLANSGIIFRMPCGYAPYGAGPVTDPLGEANLGRAENFPAQRFTVGGGCLQVAGQHKLPWYNVYPIVLYQFNLSCPKMDI